MVLLSPQKINPGAVVGWRRKDVKRGPLILFHVSVVGGLSKDPMTPKILYLEILQSLNPYKPQAL